MNRPASRRSHYDLLTADVRYDLNEYRTEKAKALARGIMRGRETFLPTGQLRELVARHLDYAHAYSYAWRAVEELVHDHRELVYVYGRTGVIRHEVAK